MEGYHQFPKLSVGNEAVKHNARYLVLTENQAEAVLSKPTLETLTKYGTFVQEVDGQKVPIKTVYKLPKQAEKIQEEGTYLIEFSPATQQLPNFEGIASNALASAFKFSRHEKPVTLPQVILSDKVKDGQFLIELAKTKMTAKAYALGRGDIEGTPQHFVNWAKSIASTHKLEATIIEGNDLLVQGFRLLHAVGRSSIHQPAFISIKYNGNPTSDQYLALVGKGIVFDTGGINMKTSEGLKQMFLDKHGACNVLAAFQTICEAKLPLNVVCAVSMAENSVSANSYRTHDIIKSRKGLTVEILNTDAQGRLVLADAMHWVQQNYKVNTMLEQSTLTGAIRIALGLSMAGLFCNDPSLITRLTQAGEAVKERVWNMPHGEDFAHEIKGKYSDLANIGSLFGGSCIAATFLGKFVEKGVKWAHIDIAGPPTISDDGIGFGAKMLYKYAKMMSLGWA